MVGLGAGLRPGRRRVGGSSGLGNDLDFSALSALPVGRQASEGWVDQATIDAFASASLWIDAFSTYTDTGGTTDAVQGDPIAAALDNITGNLFTESNAANQPTLAAGPAITGGYTKLLAGSPSTTGIQKLIIATNDGIAEAEVNLSASYDLRNVPGLVHWVAGSLSPAEIEKVKAFAIAEGAVNSWSTTSWFSYFRHMGLTSWDTPIPSSVTTISLAWPNNQLTSWDTPIPSSVTNIRSAWRNNQLTSWDTPIPSSVTTISGAWAFNQLTSWDTPIPSSVTTISFAWRGNQLTSWDTPIPSSVTTISGAWAFNQLTSWDTPIPSSVTDINFAWDHNQLTSWDTPIPSSVTDINFAWRNNPVVDFAANIFDGCPCTNFTDAFSGTALTQTSIDNILVSINSNATSNGTFDQSGGSAPSATGEAAIDAMRSRGWTITVTGGY